MTTEEELLLRKAMLWKQMIDLYNELEDLMDKQAVVSVERIPVYQEVENVSILVELRIEITAN